MKERTVLTPLQLRILQLIAERGEIPMPSEIAKELDENIGSISNSLKSLKQNLDVIRQFGQSLAKAEKKDAFGKSKRDFWQVRDRTLIEKSKQGYWIAGGRRPYGVKVEEGVVYFRPPEAIAKIQLAFKLRDEGVPYSKIEELTGIPEPRYVITNPVYCGNVRWKGIVYPGKHKDREIISQELFERVQPVKGGHFKRPPLLMKKIRGRFVWENENAEKTAIQIFEMRKKERTFVEIGEKFGIKPRALQEMINNPRYAGKEWVNGELVNDPYIDAKIDFNLWQAARKVSLRDKLVKSRRKQLKDNIHKVWKALPGAIRELENKTGLSMHQITLSLEHLKPRIVRLQDARWYRKDDLTLLLRRKLEEKGFQTLIPKYPRGIDTRDKILNILIEKPATSAQIKKKIGYDVSNQLKKYMADGLIEERSDHEYYINKENAKFVRMAEDMLQAIRRQYS